MPEVENTLRRLSARKLVPRCGKRLGAFGLGTFTNAPSFAHIHASIPIPLLYDISSGGHWVIGSLTIEDLAAYPMLKVDECASHPIEIDVDSSWFRHECHRSDMCPSEYIGTVRQLLSLMYGLDPPILPPRSRSTPCLDEPFKDVFSIPCHWPYLSHQQRALYAALTALRTL